MAQEFVHLLEYTDTSCNDTEVLLTLVEVNLIDIITALFVKACYATGWFSISKKVIHAIPDMDLAYSQSYWLTFKITIVGSMIYAQAL